MDPLPESPKLVDPEQENEDQHDVAIIGPRQLDAAEDMDQEPLANDWEAMKARYLKELPDLETESETVHTWHIKGYRQSRPKLHGPVFECGEQPWRILFFPYGNQVDHASCYLEQAHDDKPPQDWYACVQFMLVMWNPSEPLIYTQHTATHRFTADEGDWGFTRFAELRKVYAQTWEERDKPILDKGADANITAYVRIIKDPTGVLWHNFVDYDSKKITGYVGLRNQGATCYLNSLLQSLYFTNAFRKSQAIYQIPTEDEEKLTNSAYTLQRLFYLLQTSNDAVPTAELTRSFGWDSRQIFEQQDVQELSRILMERMEEKMKGTKAENALAKLFVGKTKTYISCIHVNYESSRVEDFWDIQLNVRGNKNLDESFKDYIQVETMDGDNKYFAEGHGLQDAKKGVIFESFPQVLHLQLKRFEFDVTREAMMKVNDRYEFPEEFDASPYLSDDADKSESYIYKLHGVLVHSGDFNAGHYYAFLKPSRDGHFYKFDDDRVTRATMKEVLDENFGGDYDVLNGSSLVRNPYTRTLSTKRSMSAYMLVYIRQTRIDSVLVDVTEDETPAHLQKRLDEERTLREQRKKDREEQHLYLPLAVLTAETFKHYQGTDMAKWDSDPEKDPSAPRPFRALKSLNVQEVRGIIAKGLEVEPERLRLWAMVNRQNKTVRPDQPLLRLDANIEDEHYQIGTKAAAFRLWAEITDDVPNNVLQLPELLGQNAKNARTLLFLKYFDVEKQTLTGAGPMYFPRDEKITELPCAIARYMGWPSDTPIHLYEEIKPSMIDPIKQKGTLVQAEIQDGDIICFQKAFPEKEDVRDFYDYLNTRLVVQFAPRPSLNRQEESFELVLSRRMVYDQFAAKVGEYLNVDPTHLRFSTVNATTNNPKAIVKRTGTMSLHHILTPQQGAYVSSLQLTNALFYEILDLSLSELETKKSLRVTWLSDGISKEEQYDILVPRNGVVEDAAVTLRRKANLEGVALARIRLFEVHGCKIHKMLASNASLASINDYVSLFAEKIPDEEVEAPEKAKLINAFHFNKEPNRIHGVPFRFVVKEGELFKQTKERLAKRTGWKGKQFEKIRFALVQRITYAKPVYLDDDDVLYETMSEGDDMLGLDHVDRSRTVNSGRGDGITIR
ncbi:MAG: hypothetical protein M1826_001385 [Phylliscum demangeonii]|nr:MAG: hypothetical protein M1826_001385 [Phylliscum demangeonii]